MLTYWDLAREVGRCANALKRLGVHRGDRVAIYLPMVPEAAIAMLACARIGAVHSVVFGGFSAEALRDRMNDAGAVALITADGGYRRGQVQPLKRMADAAMAETPSIKHCIVVQRRPGLVPDEPAASMTEGRDHWWHVLLDHESAACPPEAMDAEDMLFTLYTSGTTGKPKGIVHTTGGYLTHVTSTAKHVFDLNDEDVYWCTADIGWVTGHSYIVYGPLANGATVLMYEGAPDWPERDRFWRIVETYGVTILYTAPTAIRAFMKWGTEHPDRARSVDAAAPRHRRRADQSGSLGVVLRAHRKKSLPDRGHVVADRNRRHHDHAPAGRGDHQARVGHHSLSGHSPRAGGHQGESAGVGRRIPHHRRSRGRACCGRSSTTTSATARSTGAASLAATSPATGQSSTRTATGGSWGAWTTC